MLFCKHAESTYHGLIFPTKLDAIAGRRLCPGRTPLPWGPGCIPPAIAKLIDQEIVE